MVYFSVSPIRTIRLKQKFSFIRPEFLQHFANIEILNNASRNLRDMQKIEIENFQLPHLLRYEERNSMRHSIEARLPFLDYRLVEVAFSINHRFKIKNGWAKHILRTAMEGVVPHRILWRKDKLGFESPQALWIASARGRMETAIRRSGILASMCKARLDLSTIDTSTLWKLYNIARWEDIYAVQHAA